MHDEQTELLRDALMRAEETLTLLKGTKGAVSLNYRYTVHDTLDAVSAALALTKGRDDEKTRPGDRTGLHAPVVCDPTEPLV